MMNSLQEVTQLIHENNAFTIIGHANPDGDTLGCTLALGLALEQLGKSVYMLNSDEVPENYRFLPGSEQISKPTIESFPDRVLIFVDCTDLKRSGEEIIPWLSQVKLIVNIDHHISNEEFARYNIVDSDAASAGLVVMQLIKELGVKLSKEIATCLYVTLITDTGSFRYNNTTPQAHQAAAELLAAGVPQDLVNRELYEEVSLASLELVKVGLENLQLSDCGKVAWMVFSKQTIDNLTAKDEHLEGLVNYAKSVKGVEVGLLFKESEANLVKVSLRSKAKVNVSDLAAKFGGGGHIRAAGCRCKLTLSETVAQVVKAAIEAVQAKQ